MTYFITGTDTDAGKTFVTALWLRALRRAGLDAVGFKPICCGGREDAEILCEASGGAATVDEINPVWLHTPAAPYTACAIENRLIDTARIVEAFRELRAKHQAVLVEGVGGWLVPIRKDYSTADLAAELGLPVVIVVRNRLGAISHTLLTIESVKSRGLTCAGIVINNSDADDDITTRTNRSIIGELAGVPVLFEIARGQDKLELKVG
jgi:dethiobiotin synthetase